MKIQRIKIDEHKNERYYNILVDVNNKINEWNKLNNEIKKIIIPKVYPRRIKGKLNEIKTNAEKLNNEYVQWIKEISDFTINPFINVEGSENPDLTFLHFKELLVRRVRDIDDIFKLTNNNFHILTNSYNNQINFNIAISGIIISLLAFSFSIFAEFQKNTQNSNEVLIDTLSKKLENNSRKLIDHIESKKSATKTKIDSIIESTNYLKKSTDNKNCRQNEINLK